VSLTLRKAATEKGNAVRLKPTVRAAGKHQTDTHHAQSDTSNVATRSAGRWTPCGFFWSLAWL